MSALTKAVSAGVHDAARPLTASLRTSAVSTGWPQAAARGLRVTVSGVKPPIMKVHTSKTAEKAEYGDGGPPNPAVRRWANRPKPLEEILVAAVDKRLEAVL